VDGLVKRLPAPEALDLLVGATRLRWVLLRPRATWRRPENRKAWWRIPGVEHVAEADGYDLFRIDRRGDERRWYSAIHRGPSAGATVLGTPLGPLPADSAAAVVEDVNLSEMVAGRWAIISPRVLNIGGETWPAVPGESDDRFRVQLVARWQSLPTEAGGSRIPEQTCKLPWDLRPSGELRAVCFVQAPPEPGLYELLITPRQIDGASFSGPRNRPLRTQVRVRPPPEPDVEHRGGDGLRRSSVPPAS
jgi:hypothetical protein